MTTARTWARSRRANAKLGYLRFALLVLGTFLLGEEVTAMDFIQHGRFKVYYSRGCRNIAERLMTLTERSYPIFKSLFNGDHDLGLEVFWANRQDWDTVPPCRYKGSYGMPHMTKGENHVHAIILPAVNVDMSERLTRIIDPLLDTKELSPNEAQKLATWLGLGPRATSDDLRKYLSTPQFYVDFLVEIVHVHEMMHDFCFEFGIPENFGRDGRKAWWVFEGLAQWSVLWVQRRLENERWAGIHELFYRWMYRTGRKQKGNVSPIEYENYAWFHSALVEMFCQLEERFGTDYGPAVLRALLEKMRGRDYLSDVEVVRVFSSVARQDLSEWFTTSANFHKSV